MAEASPFDTLIALESEVPEEDRERGLLRHQGAQALCHDADHAHVARRRAAVAEGHGGRPPERNEGREGREGPVVKDEKRRYAFEDAVYEMEPAELTPARVRGMRSVTSTPQKSDGLIAVPQPGQNTLRIGDRSTRPMALRSSPMRHPCRATRRRPAQSSEPDRLEMVGAVHRDQRRHQPQSLHVVHQGPKGSCGQRRQAKIRVLNWAAIRRQETAGSGRRSTTNDRSPRSPRATGLSVPLQLLL